jgi:hypothetical protein
MKKQHIFVETCLYEAVGSLSVMNAFTAPSDFSHREYEGAVNAFMTESFQQLHRDMFLLTSPREHEGAVKAFMTERLPTAS